MPNIISGNFCGNIRLAYISACRDLFSSAACTQIKYFRGHISPSLSDWHARLIVRFAVFFQVKKITGELSLQKNTYSAS